MDLQMELKFRLRDCQGKELQVAGVRTASVVVEDEDGSQAELETQFVVSESVKSCILSLGQLYRAGWSVQQNSSGPTLEFPDRTLRVPVFFQRMSLSTILRSPARPPQLQSLTGFWSLKGTVEQTSLNKTNNPHHSKRVKPIPGLPCSCCRRFRFGCADGESCGRVGRQVQA